MDQALLKIGDKTYLAFGWGITSPMMVVGDDGNVVKPFAGYPKTGTYRVAGQLLQLTFDGAESVERLHMHRQNGRILLLTGAENAAWEASGRYEGCALMRESEKGD